MKTMLTLLAALGAAAAFAAAPGKDLPVAEGFPVWQGVTPRNFVRGREICPSDLRHKVVIVLEVEPNAEKLQGELLKAGNLASLNPLSASGFGENWETRVLPRDVIFVVSVRGGGKNIAETINAALKVPKTMDENNVRILGTFKSPSVPIYSDLTYAGAPDTTGKRPYVYVMGPSGTVPLAQGSATEAATIKSVRAAVAKAKKTIVPDGGKWDPFYGTVTEPTKFPALAKVLEKGRTARMAPLAPVEKALLKDIAGKDAEKAKEAQIVYDALEQTRSELVMRIQMEARECPHRAAYDLQQLLKFWPAEKKRVEEVAAKLKQNPDANKLAQMFCKTMVWSDPAFTCKNAGEAKKIVAELNKMKKDLDKLKKSEVIVIQNGALLMDAQVDELIATIPSRLPEK